MTLWVRTGRLEEADHLTVMSVCVDGLGLPGNLGRLHSEASAPNVDKQIENRLILRVGSLFRLDDYSIMNIYHPSCFLVSIVSQLGP